MTQAVQPYKKGAVSSPKSLPVDHVTGLPRDVFPGDYSEKERAMIMAICERYGFDPLLKEVELLHGQIFVTAKGIARVATDNPTFNGIEVEIIHQDWTKGKEFFVVKARVWKKGCEHPIEDIADSDGSKMKGGNLFRHTITRAKARAMRTAFAIPFCSTEELADEDRPVVVPQVPQVKRAADPLPSDQDQDRHRRRFFTVANEKGLTEAQQRALLGVASRKDATPERFLECAQALEAWGQTERELVLACLEAPTVEEMRDLYRSLPDMTRDLISPSCKLRSKQLQEGS